MLSQTDKFISLLCIWNFEETTQAGDKGYFCLFLKIDWENLTVMCHKST